MKTIINRFYEVRMYEGGCEFTAKSISIDDILFPPKNAYEFIYALQDEINKILDLKIGEAMYFQPNRDNHNSKGIILRTDK